VTSMGMGMGMGMGMNAVDAVCHCEKLIGVEPVNRNQVKMSSRSISHYCSHSGIACMLIAPTAVNCLSLAITA